MQRNLLSEEAANSVAPASESAQFHLDVPSQHGMERAAADAVEAMFNPRLLRSEGENPFCLLTPPPPQASRDSRLSVSLNERQPLEATLQSLSDRPLGALFPSASNAEHSRLVEELQERLVGLLRQESRDSQKNECEFSDGLSLPSLEQRQLQLLIEQLQNQQRQIVAQQRRLRTLHRAKMMEQTELLQRRLFSQQLLELQACKEEAEEEHQSSLSGNCFLPDGVWPTLLQCQTLSAQQPPSPLEKLTFDRVKSNGRRKNTRRKMHASQSSPRAGSDDPAFPQLHLQVARSSVSTVAPRSSVSSACSVSSPRDLTARGSPTQFVSPPLSDLHLMKECEAGASSSTAGLGASHASAGSARGGGSSGISLPSLQRRMQKTKLCRFHMLSCCSRGRQCVFAHSLEELRERPNLRRTKMCPSILQQGSCARGSACNFAHAEEELRSTPEFYKTSICGAVAAGRPCTLGASCRFAHSERELRTRPNASRTVGTPPTHPEEAQLLQALQRQVYLQLEEELRQQRAFPPQKEMGIQDLFRRQQELYLQNFGVHPPSPVDPQSSCFQGPDDGHFFFPGVWAGAARPVSRVAQQAANFPFAFSGPTPAESIQREEGEVASAEQSSANTSSEASTEDALKPDSQSLEACADADSQQSTCAQCPFLAVNPTTLTKTSDAPSEAWLEQIKSLGVTDSTDAKRS